MSRLPLLPLLLAALVALVFWQWRETRSSMLSDSANAKTLWPGLSPSQSRRVSLSHGARTWQLERSSRGSWELSASKKPHDEQSASVQGLHEAVEEVLTTLAWAEVQRRLRSPGPSDLRRFGLSPPQLQLRVWAGSKDLRLDIGRSDAEGSGLYLRFADAPEVLVTQVELRRACERLSRALP